jgi:NADPH-dependent 2,4-dienoyl-CoA reductase/sulfur reductase-like enzyme
VILGGGSRGTLVANRLRSLCGDASGIRIVLIDKDDPLDHEIDLLTAPGLPRPQAPQYLPYLPLRDGVEFRRAEAATVDTARAEVCLVDGTTVAYDALVVATGATPIRGGTGDGRESSGAPCVRRSPGLGDERGFVPVDPRTLQCPDRPGVFAIGGATGTPPSPPGRGALAQVEALAEHIRRYLAGGAHGTTGPELNGSGGEHRTAPAAGEHATAL